MIEFGDKIKYWFTFNEPIVEPEAQFLHGQWYPYLHDFKQSINVQYGITLAHCLAVSNFRQLQADGIVRKDAKIGMINCFAPPYTKDNPTPEDLEAVRMTDGLHNRWWLDVVAHGHLPEDVIDTVENDWGVKIDRRVGDEEILAQGKVDWLGFNYYQPTRVQAPDSKFDENGLPCISKPYIWPERKMNVHRGWEIYPKGIYDIAINIKNNYGNIEWMITENGMGVENEERFRKDGMIHDDYRIDFYKEHLTWLHKGIEEGSNCIGYHVWTFIDCWSWINAYKNRYGLIELDLETQERRIKKSGQWFKELSEKGGF